MDRREHVRGLSALRSRHPFDSSHLEGHLLMLSSGIHHVEATGGGQDALGIGGGIGVQRLPRKQAGGEQVLPAASHRWRRKLAAIPRATLRSACSCKLGLLSLPEQAFVLQAGRHGARLRESVARNHPLTTTLVSRRLVLSRQPSREGAPCSGVSFLASTLALRCATTFCRKTCANQSICTGRHANSSSGQPR